jgi:hypothetical protein
MRYEMKIKKLRFLAAVGLVILLIGGGNSVRAAEKAIYQKDPESCAKCHMIKPYVESWKNSDFLAHKHQKAGVGCLECHQVTLQQQKDHLTKSKKKAYKTPLEEREYGNEACFSCHGSYKDLIERTKNFGDRGLPKNPHKSHYGEIDCNMCHKAHRTSIDYCSQCHQSGLNKPGWKTL